jgi:hypothetical protein
MKIYSSGVEGSACLSESCCHFLTRTLYLLYCP